MDWKRDAPRSGGLRSHRRPVFPAAGRDAALMMTRRGIEDRGGIVLDMCSSLGWLRKPGTLPAYICENCRKMIVEYGYGTLGL